jgi:hypothetical protein
MSELSVGQLRGLTVNSNVITVPSGHKLYAPGHVVQVVSADYAVEVSTTSTSFVTTGLTATITPSSTLNKILIIANTSAISPNNSTSGAWTVFRGTTAGTNIATNAMSQVYSGAAGELRTRVSMSVVDSPTTISPQVYTLAFNSNGAGTMKSQGGNQQGNITLMEIAQ